MKHLHIHVHRHRVTDAGWDESKHKRDASGQFASTFKPAETKRGHEALDKLKQGQFKGEHSTEHIFGNKVEGRWNYGTEGHELPSGGEPTLVATSHLIPTQGTVESEQVRSFLKNKRYENQGVPVAVRDAKTGKYYIQDGHHRLSADILAGRKASMVHVIEVKGHPTD